MPTPTVTTQLDASLPTIISSARLVREQEGDMPALVERRSLDEGTGDTWHEVSYAKLTAQAVTETTENDNIQQVSDTDFAVKPTLIQIATMLTDKVGRNITKNGLREIGKLGQARVGEAHGFEHAQAGRILGQAEFLDEGYRLRVHFGVVP